jgi:hypothetical protein
MNTGSRAWRSGQAVIETWVGCTTRNGQRRAWVGQNCTRRSGGRRARRLSSDEHESGTKRICWQRSPLLHGEDGTAHRQQRAPSYTHPPNQAPLLQRLPPAAAPTEHDTPRTVDTFDVNCLAAAASRRRFVFRDLPRSAIVSAAARRICILKAQSMHTWVARRRTPA